MREADERLDKRDYFGRQWVARFAADAAIVADELYERLCVDNTLPQRDDA